MVLYFLQIDLAFCESQQFLRLTQLNQSTPLQLRASDLSELTTQLNQAIADNLIPGAYVQLGDRHGNEIHIPLGQRGPNNPAPMNGKTLFRIFSMTKPIVSVLTMRLIERNQLSLDDPISLYLNQYKTMKILDSNGRKRQAKIPMTVRHLLSHQSGLIYGVFDRNSKLGRLYLRNRIYSDDRSLFQLASKLGELPIKFEPGSAWQYSRSTDVLGAVLELATQQSIETLLKEEIFKPLAMDDTYFFASITETPRVAEALDTNFFNPSERKKMLSTGGGLLSTATDYGRFAKMLLEGGQGRIQSATLAMMTTDAIAEANVPSRFFYPQMRNFGLGFGLFESPVGQSGQRVKTYGWGGIAGTQFWIDESHGFYFILMIQKSNQRPLRINLRDVVYRAIDNASVNQPSLSD